MLVAGPIIATFLFGMVRFQQRLFAFRRSPYTGTGVRVAVVGAGTRRRGRAPRDAAVAACSGSCPWSSSTTTRRCAAAIHPRRADRRPHRRAPRRSSPTTTSTRSCSPCPRRRAGVVQQVADRRRGRDIPVRVLRESSSWVHGMPRLRDMRDLNIEDLLGREQVEHRPRAGAPAAPRPPGAGHRRRRLDRLRDRPPGRRVRARAARAARPRRDPPPRHRATTCRASPSPRSSSPTSATRTVIDAVFAASAPRSCSTPPRTSTCPSSRTTRARRSAPTCSAPSTCSTRATVADVSQLVCISTDKAATPTQRDGRVEVGGRAARARRAPRTTATARCASATCSAAAAA